MNDKDFHKFYDSVYSQDTKFTDKEAHGWIQWKGTDVCMDIHCPCGESGHVDVDFFYYYKCKCGKKYAVGQNIKLIELTEEQSNHEHCKDRFIEASKESGLKND